MSDTELETVTNVLGELDDEVGGQLWQVAKGYVHPNIVQDPEAWIRPMEATNGKVCLKAVVSMSRWWYGLNESGELIRRVPKEVKARPPESDEHLRQDILHRDVTIKPRLREQTPFSPAYHD
jgi:hypothetical protein